MYSRLSYPMEQSSFKRSAGQILLFRNPKVHNRFPKSPTVDPNLRRMEPVHILLF
jgi:hypothetical protein